MTTPAVPPRWSDRDGRRTQAPEPPPSGSHYRSIGDFQGPHYDRNAFAGGTAQEVDFLWDVLGLERGSLVADVGCGTGRHARALAARGARVVGVDLSAGLLAVGVASGLGAYVQGDARALPLPDAAFGAAVCLCQGGFGITPVADRAAIAELARVLRPGGRLALTAFSLAFAARWLAPGDQLDVGRGLVHTTAEVRGADAAKRTFDLWTSCYSAGELAALLEAVGLEPELLAGAEPGDYGRRPPSLADPELLVVARRPGPGLSAPPMRGYG